MNKKDYLILESMIDKYGARDILNELSINEDLKNKLRKIIATGVIGAGVLAGNSVLTDYRPSANEVLAKEMNTYIGTLASDAEKELDAFMKIAVRNQGYNYNNCELSPSEIIRKCIETKFDIGLLGAQANLESCFGMSNRCRLTNNVFSVGLYDNGENRCVYKTQNESILPYIKIIQRDYLMNGKLSVDDIIQDRHFVNMNGDRYASDKEYEYKIRNIRDRIFESCPALKKLSTIITQKDLRFPLVYESCN